MAWSPDGSQLAVSYSDGALHILHVSVSANTFTTRIVRPSGTPHSGLFLTCLQWSPDGSRIVARSSLGTHLVDPTTGQLSRVFRDSALDNITSRCRDITAYAWNPDSHGIASLSDGEVYMWNIDKPREVDRLRYSNREPEHIPVVIDVSYGLQWRPVPAGAVPAPTNSSSPSTVMATATAEGPCLYDLTRQEKLERAQPVRIPGIIGARGLAWSPDGACIAFLGNSRNRSNSLTYALAEATVWSVAPQISSTPPVLQHTLAPADTPGSPARGKSHAQQLAWSRDGREIAAAVTLPQKTSPFSYGLTWWDAATGRPTASLYIPHAVPTLNMPLLKRRLNYSDAAEDAANCVFSPALDKFAVAFNFYFYSTDTTITRYDRTFVYSYHGSIVRIYLKPG